MQRQAPPRPGATTAATALLADTNSSEAMPPPAPRRLPPFQMKQGNTTDATITDSGLTDPETTPPGTPPPPSVIHFALPPSAPAGYLATAGHHAVTFCNGVTSSLGSLTNSAAERAAHYEAKSLVFEALFLLAALAYFFEHRGEVSFTAPAMILAYFYIASCCYMAFRTMSFGRNVRAAATALIPGWKPEYAAKLYNNGYKLLSTVFAATGAAGLLYGVHHTVQTTDPTNPLGQFTTGLAIVATSSLSLLASNLLSARGELPRLQLMGMGIRNFKPRAALSSTVLGTAGAGVITLLAAFGMLSKFAIDMQNTTFTDQRHLTGQQTLEKFLSLGLGLFALFLLIDAVALVRDKMERLAYQCMADQLTRGAIPHFDVLRSVNPNAWVRNRATCDKIKLMTLLAASAAFVVGVDLYGQTAVPIGMLFIAFLTRLLAKIDKNHQIDLATKLCLLFKYYADFIPPPSRQIEELEDEEPLEGPSGRGVAGAMPSATTDASVPSAPPPPIASETRIRIGAPKSTRAAASTAFNIEAPRFFTEAMYGQVARLAKEGRAAWKDISHELEPAMQEQSLDSAGLLCCLPFSGRRPSY